MNKKVTKKEIKDDLANIMALEAVQHSEGGKLLIASSLQDIVSSIDTLAGSYAEMTHIDLISHCARLRERLALYRALKNASKNKKYIQEALEEALTEEPD